MKYLTADCTSNNLNASKTTTRFPLFWLSTSAVSSRPASDKVRFLFDNVEEFNLVELALLDAAPESLIFTAICWSKKQI